MSTADEIDSLRAMVERLAEQNRQLMIDKIDALIATVNELQVTMQDKTDANSMTFADYIKSSERSGTE